METEQLIRILEGALLAAGKPLTVPQLAELFEEQERPDIDQIREALSQLTEHCAGRGFELRQVASGYRFQVVEDVAPWVGRLWEEKPQRYSRALLETLALIAYRQPITRGDIEDIRGVAVSSQIIKTLLEREWVRVVGHKDVPGRPAMYATTRKFLDYFNMSNLDDLPALADIKDLDTLTGELKFDDSEQPAGNGENGEQSDERGLLDDEAEAAEEAAESDSPADEPADLSVDSADNGETEDSEAVISDASEPTSSDSHVETEDSELNSHQ
ncbi:segregation and condensation protein B [Litorivivens lipolytica]|uniref:Segregation and condensation protein B n=1 Tax=Litorivivens lipolytica TaxID=1524264 RepID=A0A7W4Z5L1_9GAMM|nr:SMC-Scp complex subunit ScpB [Litorivivens lipolytica]MBB3046081.1 segregation and condensation protein B [Litorivivens lipolytica]